MRGVNRKRDSGLPYPPGQRIPYSGIYRVQHYLHRPAHEVTMIEGDFFPQCRTCEQQVRFVPVCTADRLREDYDFYVAPGPVVLAVD
jgi:hypothetical protein